MVAADFDVSRRGRCLLRPLFRGRAVQKCRRHDTGLAQSVRTGNAVYKSASTVGAAHAPYIRAKHIAYRIQHQGSSQRNSDGVSARNVGLRRRCLQEYWDNGSRHRWYGQSHAHAFADSHDLIGCESRFDDQVEHFSLGQRARTKIRVAARIRSI